MRSDRERLLDIVEAIERIGNQVTRGRSVFIEDVLVQTAVIRWIEIIGEAARAISPELREAHPEIPWRQVVAMRNILVHGYFEVDVDAVWSAIEHDTPKLEAQVRAILDDMTG